MKFVDSLLVKIKPGENFQFAARWTGSVATQVDVSLVKFKLPVGMEPEDFMALLQAAGLEVEGIVVDDPADK